MFAVVEFHGFKDYRGRFVVKELAIVGTCIKFCGIFESRRVHLSKENDWLDRNFHGVGWEDGNLPFSFKLVCSLLRPFDVVYTKGLEKKIFLSTFHRNVVELDEGWKVPADFKVDCILSQHRILNAR